MKRSYVLFIFAICMSIFTVKGDLKKDLDKLKKDLQKIVEDKKPAKESRAKALGRNNIILEFYTTLQADEISKRLNKYLGKEWRRMQTIPQMSEQIRKDMEMKGKIFKGNGIYVRYKPKKEQISFTMEKKKESDKKTRISFVIS